jgi:hypothetical protein
MKFNRHGAPGDQRRRTSTMKKVSKATKRASAALVEGHIARRMAEGRDVYLGKGRFVERKDYKPEIHGPAVPYMSRTVVMLDEETTLGRYLTRDEFARLDPCKVYDDLMRGGACGAPAYIFMREDGTIGVDDANSVYLDDDDYEAAA